MIHRSLGAAEGNIQGIEVGVAEIDVEGHTSVVEIQGV